MSGLYILFSKTSDFDIVGVNDCD